MRSAVDDASDEVRDCISRDVIAWLEGIGAAPVLVPNGLRDVARFVRDAGARGLVLTGGNDIGDDVVRDEAEGELLGFAAETRLPVFGVCRGLQLVVRVFGGGAPQRIEPAKSHVGSHAVELREAMGELVGPCDRRVMTNSFHDFGVREESVPADLEVLAMSPDGFVEALRHRALPMVAVQWHPERAGSCAALDERLARVWSEWCAQAAEVPA